MCQYQVSSLKAHFGVYLIHANNWMVLYWFVQNNIHINKQPSENFIENFMMMPRKEESMHNICLRRCTIVSNNLHDNILLVQITSAVKVLVHI